MHSFCINCSKCTRTAHYPFLVQWWGAAQELGSSETKHLYTDVLPYFFSNDKVTFFFTLDKEKCNLIIYYARPHACTCELRQNCPVFAACATMWIDLIF